MHEALPDVDQCAIDLTTAFVGRALRAPLLIAGMTGGHRTAHDVNAVLARAAERHGLAMGVGSQRAALRRADLAYTYTVVRQQAPTALLIGNIGAPQLIAQGAAPPLTLDEIRSAVAMIGADALAVHLNFLQESVQPEGERNARGAAIAIRQVVEALAPCRCMAKETGAGISRETATRLKALGIRALDVGGVGRHQLRGGGGTPRRRAGRYLEPAAGRAVSRLGIADAGIDRRRVRRGTAGDCHGRHSHGHRRRQSAGARGDAGRRRATRCCKPRSKAMQAVDAWIGQFLNELRTALFLTGSGDIAELRAKPRVVTGLTRVWIDQLGY